MTLNIILGNRWDGYNFNTVKVHVNMDCIHEELLCHVDNWKDSFEDYDLLIGRHKMMFLVYSKVEGI